MKNIYIIVLHKSDYNTGYNEETLNYCALETRERATVICKRLNETNGSGATMLDNGYELDEIIGDEYFYYTIDEVSVKDESDRYEVVRQDNGQRLWYIWDNNEGITLNDDVGNTIYYDTYEEAQDECEELNAMEE